MAHAIGYAVVPLILLLGVGMLVVGMVRRRRG